MAFTWAAIYHDGTVFPQIDPATGSERSSERIDRKRLSSFILYGHDRNPLFVQHFDPGHRLIYRRRVEQEPGGQTLIVHLVGWQETAYARDGTPKDYQHMTYAFENDNKIVMAGKWRAEHRWYYPVQSNPAEEVAVE